MKNLLLVLGTLLIVSCRSAGPAQEAKPDAFFRTVRIESAPPGARVFIAYGVSEAKSEGKEEFLGVTPCEARIAALRNGEFEIKPHIAIASHFGAPPVAVILCRSGTNEQRHIYKKAAFGREGDKIPAALFFDFAR